MHPNPKFHWQSTDEMTAFVRAVGFGTLVAQTPDGLRAVHLPALVNGNILRFHLARANAVHSTLIAGSEALFVVNGAHAYISPDWYGVPDRVPTWNYVAVELEGRVQRLGEDALVEMLDDLSAEHEERLAPKRPWTRAKMSEGRFESMLRAITAFQMEIGAWRGTVKLGQDKPEEARTHVGEALSDLGQHEIAALIRGDGR